MDYGFAFAIGLLGSLHCAAMCGPLMLALPAPAGGAGRFVSGRVIYQLGRVVTYCLLGVAAGLLGKSVYLAGLQRWLSIALGIAILGGFFLSKKIALSDPVLRFVTKLKAAMSAQLRRRSFSALALLGMLNGLLPCGLVYVAATGAVSLGSVPAGVGYMAAFGIGTVPTLLTISLSGKLLPLAFRSKLRAAIPAGVCLLAALLILRGLALGIPYFSPDLATGGCCAR
jgi:sulfite exporter TauE/SafE